MNRPLLTALFIAITLMVRPISACEKYAFPPVASGPGNYALSGVVKGHIAREVSWEEVGPAPGVVVEVRESSGSVSPGTRIEVIPLAADLGCDPIPRDPSDVKEQYPLGAQVTLVLRQEGEARSIAIVESGSFGYLARAPIYISRKESDCLDFKSFRHSYELNDDPFSPEVAWRNAHRGWFEDHELLRCYNLIETMDSSKERVDALRNLVFYWRWFDAGNRKLAEKLYGDVLKQHGVRRHDRRQLMASFRASREAD